MPKSITIEARFFDTCFSDYIVDWSGIVVGVPLAGQNRDEIAESAADEAYDLAQEEFDDFPLGGHTYERIRDAIRDTIKADARFWPVDADGNEIDTDANDASDDPIDVPEEQPCAWFRVLIKISPMVVRLDNQGDDHHEYGHVLVECDDRDAAISDACIDGSTWETPRDMNVAYASLMDRPTLVQELEAEGYEVDTSCYSPPDADDLARWRAQCDE